MYGHIARRLVRLYPRAWRARYEDEFFALLDASSTGWRDLPDIARGAAREWLRLTPVGRALGVAVEMWLTAIVWSLAVASIGSLITGVARLALGLDSVLTLPFLTMDLVRGMFVELPVAIAIGALVAAPWLIVCRSFGLARWWTVGVRVLSLTPFVIASAWLILSGEQLVGVIAAGWILSARVSPRRPIESLAR